MTWICIECCATFEDAKQMAEHMFTKPGANSGSKVWVPKVKHNVFTFTGGGRRTDGSTEPTGQAAVPFLECETPPASPVATLFDGVVTKLEYNSVAQIITSAEKAVP